MKQTVEPPICKVFINRKNIHANIAAICNYLAQNTCELVICTKSLLLAENLLTLFDKKYTYFDSKLENICFLQDHGYSTISNHALLSKNHNFIVDNKKISKANIQQRRHLYLFFDFGDNREGLSVNDISFIAQELKKQFINTVTLMSNIGCLSTAKPSTTYFNKFIIVRNELEKTGIHVERFSLGGSNCIPVIRGLQTDIKKELRIGEAILFGSFNNMKMSNLHLHKNNIFLESRIVRKITEYKYVCDFGYCNIEQNAIKQDSFRIIHQSSYYSLIQTKQPMWGNKISIPLNYHGLSKLSEQRNTKVILL